MRRVGFACAYAPLALIDAAGFVPFRVLPLGDAPEQAGSLLHDNLCPHVKRLLDRALAADLPDLEGVVFMNSCDAMRRLADAWPQARPADRVLVLDLPVTADEASIDYFAAELERCRQTLADWGGKRVAQADLEASLASYRELSSAIGRLAARAREGGLDRGALQALLNRSVTEPLEATIAEARELEARPSATSAAGVPVYLFGNVLPLPEAFELFEAAGLRVVEDDVCTGARQLAPISTQGDLPLLTRLARGLLERPPCARTVRPSAGGLAEQVLAAARAAGARGVIAHVMKFCDPYLARLPAVREDLADAGLPLLVLEGDVSLRSLGQYRTRIEAFAEMLGGAS